MLANCWLRRKGFGNLIISYRLSGIPFFLLLFSILWPIPSFAATQLGSQQLTKQEKWVLNQVKEGREADLEREFNGSPEMQRLRPTFLEKLILGDFPNCRIPHRGIQIDHANIDGPLNLEYIEVDYPLSLSKCLFQKTVSFQESHFKKDLILSSCKFLQPANFTGVKVDGNVFCNDAIFEEESLWSGAKIGEKLHAIRAGFRSNQAKADFSAMKVGSNAIFTSATFYGPVDFGLVHIGGQFNINRAEFFNKQETVNFISAKVEQIAYFKQVKFHGPVDFAIAQIGFQFNADEAEFLCLDKKANFSGIKVGNTIYFQRAKFHGPVKFEFAEIGVNFRGTEAAFLNESQTKNLSKMKVSQKVFLDKTVMAGKFDMSYGNFYELDIQGLGNDEIEHPELKVNLSLLNLKGIQVQRELKIANVVMSELDASNLEVKGPAQLIDANIKNMADFRNSTFQGLDIKDTKWPDKDKINNIRKVYLNEMSYNSINIDKPENRDYDEQDFLKIRDFVEASPFTTQGYIQLDTFFKRIGRETWANEMFIRMHDRELAEKMAWWDPRRWLKWFFWGVLAGYGRAPFRVLFISILLVLMGALLYDPEYLQGDIRSRDRKAYKSVILRIFLSLDRFLPLELGLGKNWDSRASHFLIWFYFYFQLILGWILIPIVLASIYTQIK